MKIAIIGSQGFIGKALTNSLCQDQFEVQAISSRDGDFNLETGQIRSSLKIEPETQTVVYLAQSPYYRDPQKHWRHLMEVNCLSALRVAEMARQAGVLRFIYFSTGTVYASSFEPLHEHSAVRRDLWYTLSKIHAEEALSLVGEDLEVIRVRPFGVYGPSQVNMLVPRLIQKIRTGQSIQLEKPQEEQGDAQGDAQGEGQGNEGGLRISVCYIDDAIRITRCLIDHGGPPVMNLAGPEAVSIKRIANIIGKTIGIEPKIECSQSVRSGDLWADISLMNQVSSHPQMGIEQGLEMVCYQ